MRYFRCIMHTAHQHMIRRCNSSCNNVTRDLIVLRSSWFNRRLGFCISVKITRGIRVSADSQPSVLTSIRYEDTRLCKRLEVRTSAAGYPLRRAIACRAPGSRGTRRAESAVAIDLPASGRRTTRRSSAVGDGRALKAVYGRCRRWRATTADRAACESTGTYYAITRDNDLSFSSTTFPATGRKSSRRAYYATCTRALQRGRLLRCQCSQLFVVEKRQNHVSKSPKLSNPLRIRNQREGWLWGRESRWHSVTSQSSLRWNSRRSRSIVMR